MKIPIWKRVVEFFAFTYFNWAVVVPSLIPFMILWVKVDETQLFDWIYMSVFTSLYIGWVTVKADSKFAPWFYKLMKMVPPKTREQRIVERLEEEHKKFQEQYERLGGDNWKGTKPRVFEIFDRILKEEK